MMQHQETERLASTYETEASASNETHKTANEQEILLNINFDNVEDILDLSAPHVTKNTTITSPERLPELYKITEEPVMLPEIQPQNNFTSDKEDEADYATNLENKGKRRFKCSFCGKKLLVFPTGNVTYAFILKTNNPFAHIAKNHLGEMTIC